MKKILIGTAIALVTTLTAALGGRAYFEHRIGKNFAYDCGIAINEVEAVKEEK